MRLFGGHDFYDAVQAHGADPSVVMMRKNEELSHREVPFSGHHTLRMKDGNWDKTGNLKHLTVVFGSKVYHGVEVYPNYTAPLQYFWDVQKLRDWLVTQKGVSVTVGRVLFQKTQVELDEYFRVEDAPDTLREYMIANRYAIILKVETYHGDPKVWMNPHDLKKFGFAKALDPYTAYQELSMWVGGVLCGQSPAVVHITDDKVILEGHGFDNKISFRGPRV
jgi:hypothetical protein